MRATLPGFVVTTLTVFLLAPALSLASVPAATTAQPAPAAVTATPAAATSPSPAPAAPQPAVDKSHRLVKIETNMGDIVVQLDAVSAPLSVKNFLAYVKGRYYDGSGFYRVVPGFVIQGGDFTSDLTYHQPKHPPIPNECGNGLPNQRGSLALARDTYPHSATSAFYINLADNTQRLGAYPGHWCYAVFGQVVAGLDVVDKIATVPTGTVTLMDKENSTFKDVPKTAVKILKVTLLPLSDAGKP
ncbi:MAG TPA: peptidylprolyl isomerase [Gammaproteobacteria bacterium]|nr:peptidylprolyl isomerase [Gammaproteobacteria bacterium]